jgi:choline monooxygenase
MFNPHLPIEEAHTLPSIYYTQPPDESKIFHRSWQFAGHTYSLQNIGDSFTTQIANEPILIVKNENGIEALSNVCRHRGTILSEGQRNCNKFVCPYHGWTYSLKGELLGCTEFEGVNINKHNNGLPKFEVLVREPFIFVNINNRYGTSFDLPKMDYWFHSTKTYDIKCNWKVFVDNYLDGGYHIKYAHKSLAKAVNDAEYKTFINDMVVTQTTPLDGSDLRKGTAQYIWVFPNFMVNISDEAMDANLVIPVDKDNCKVVFDFYFKGPAKIAESLELSEKIQQEDIEICEKVQRGMKSKFYEYGRFAKREIGVYYFHKLINLYL